MFSLLFFFTHLISSLHCYYYIVQKHNLHFVQKSHEYNYTKDRYVAQVDIAGAPPQSQASGWGSQASAPWAETRSGTARSSDMGPATHPQEGPWEKGA